MAYQGGYPQGGYSGNPQQGYQGQQSVVQQQGYQGQQFVSQQQGYQGQQAVPQQQGYQGQQGYQAQSIPQQQSYQSQSPAIPQQQQAYQNQQPVPQEQGFRTQQPVKQRQGYQSQQQPAVPQQQGYQTPQPVPQQGYQNQRPAVPQQQQSYQNQQSAVPQQQQSYQNQQSAVPQQQQGYVIPSDFQRPSPTKIWEGQSNSQQQLPPGLAPPKAQQQQPTHSQSPHHVQGQMGSQMAGQMGHMNVGIQSSSQMGGAMGVPQMGAQMGGQGWQMNQAQAWQPGNHLGGMSAEEAWRQQQAVFNQLREIAPVHVPKPIQPPKQATDSSVNKFAVWPPPDPTAAPEQQTQLSGVELAKAEGGEEEKGCNVFVGNLPEYVVDDQLRGLFSLLGEVVEVRLNKPKNIAFIEFAEPSVAAKACRFNRQPLQLYMGGPFERLRLNLARERTEEEKRRARDKLEEDARREERRQREAERREERLAKLRELNRTENLTFSSSNGKKLLARLKLALGEEDPKASATKDREDRGKKRRRYDDDEEEDIGEQYVDVVVGCLQRWIDEGECTSKNNDTFFNILQVVASRIGKMLKAESTFNQQKEMEAAIRAETERKRKIMEEEERVRLRAAVGGMARVLQTVIGTNRLSQNFTKGQRKNFKHWEGELFKYKFRISEIQEAMKCDPNYQKKSKQPDHRRSRRREGRDRPDSLEEDDDDLAKWHPAYVAEQGTEVKPEEPLDIETLMAKQREALEAARKKRAVKPKEEGSANIEDTEMGIEEEAEEEAKSSVEAPAAAAPVKQEALKQEVVEESATQAVSSTAVAEVVPCAPAALSPLVPAVCPIGAKLVVPCALFMWNHPKGATAASVYNHLRCLNAMVPYDLVLECLQNNNEVFSVTNPGELEPNFRLSVHETFGRAVFD